MTESREGRPNIPSVETLNPEWRRMLAEQIEATFVYYGAGAEIISLGPISLSGYKLEEGEVEDNRGWGS